VREDQAVEWKRSSYCSAGARVEVAWTRSSACAGGECVEVAQGAGAVLVRDGKDRGGPVLRFTAAEWSAFVAGVQAGEFAR
jgi:hypothetical protein